MVDRLLAQDADDRAWAEQIGLVYRQTDVAALLGKSKQAVSEDRKLLRLTMRSGAVGYPAFQFDGRRQVPGVGLVTSLLGQVAETPWTIASWLTSPQLTFDGHTPIDRLRAGEVDAVVTEAKRFAGALAR